MSQFCYSTINTIKIITPPVVNLFRLKLALQTLRYKSHKDYVKVLENIKTIFIISEKGYNNAIYAKHKLWLLEGSLLEDSTYDSSYLSSLLLHEAHRVSLYKRNKDTTEAALELGAYSVQQRFFKQISDEQVAVWLKKQFQNKWWESFYNDDEILTKFDDHLRLFLNWKCKSQNVTSQ